MPEESTDYQSLRDIFRQQSEDRKLFGLRSRDNLALSEAITIQDARKAAMEAKASLAIKFGSPLADKIALTMLGPIVLPEEAFTKGNLPSEEQALDVAAMHHIITNSIYAATLKGADPSLILGVGNMLKVTSEIYHKNPGAFRFFQARENGIRAEYVALKLFSDGEAENGTRFRVYTPNPEDREEVRRWELKGETDLICVAERGDRRMAIAIDVKSGFHSRGSFMTLLDPSMNQRRMHSLAPDLRNFLNDQGQGNVSFATVNISTAELSPFEPVEVPQKGITMTQINQTQQSIRNFGALPPSDARSIITAASRL